MKEKIINLKNRAIPFIKMHKMPLIIVSIIILVLIVIAIVTLASKPKIGNLSGNLNNRGFSVKSGSHVYYLGFEESKTDGIYRVKTNGKDKKKISDDYGLYLNISGNYLYYLEASENNYNSYNIVKMKTNGKDKEVVVEGVDTSKITVVNNYIYYFKNYQLYRVKTNGKNKEQISNRSMENYEVIGNSIYYSYMNDGKYVIAKMKTNGDSVKRIDTDASKTFFVNNNDIYYIRQSADTSNYELYKIKTNGESKEKIADISGDIRLDSINFDVSKLYYTKTNEDGTLSIYSIKTNGKDETKIVDTKGYSTMINVNKNYIYYTDKNDNGDSDMFIVKANGGNNASSI